jgi:succinyl-CoA synthetase beta subunit
MNCATLAEGIISAAAELKLKVPLVVRMEGTNVDKGRYLLQQSGLNITTAEDFADAAQKAVVAAGVLNF